MADTENCQVRSVELVVTRPAREQTADERVVLQMIQLVYQVGEFLLERRHFQSLHDLRVEWETFWKAGKQTLYVQVRAVSSSPFLFVRRQNRIFQIENQAEHPFWLEFIDVYKADKINQNRIRSSMQFLLFISNFLMISVQV